MTKTELTTQVNEAIAAGDGKVSSQAAALILAQVADGEVPERQAERILRLTIRKERS